MNFAYTILDEGDLAHSYEGNHCLAIFRAPDNYESLKCALLDIIKEVSPLQFISVNGQQYKIEFYMGGDWKYLATVTGEYNYNIIARLCSLTKVQICVIVYLREASC